MENTVFIQLNRTKRPLGKISYNQGDGECDFVFQLNDSVVQLVQVTWDMAGEDTHEREIKGLLEVSSATKCDNLFIITKDEEREITKEGKLINVMPAWKWLLQNN